ncbi:Arc family DNA-binding protein [Clostridium algoriphilum]|uniref:RepB family protein n=1 Tax=Clostridium algoriphilum TaxID=198347 RepID=UPI001CF284F8|nr:RepB family protein [Clostridium algoriphilum]MCB2293517.1 Arc family DNA-binding protein [Clostridium algoriphilum]
MITRINIRTSQTIKDMLQKLCEDEGRTMTKEIEQLIKEKYKKSSRLNWYLCQGHC